MKWPNPVYRKSTMSNSEKVKALFPGEYLIERAVNIAWPVYEATHQEGYKHRIDEASRDMLNEILIALENLTKNGEFSLNRTRLSEVINALQVEFPKLFNPRSWYGSRAIRDYIDAQIENENMLVLADPIPGVRAGVFGLIRSPHTRKKETPTWPSGGDIRKGTVLNYGSTINLRINKKPSR